MGTKGFEHYTVEMAEAHNRRIAEGKKKHELKTPNLPPNPPVFLSDFKPSKSKRKKGMNQTEKAFHLILQVRHPDCQIHFESVVLKLGEDCRYCPDFFVVNAQLGIQIFYEVKGKHVWDDAKVKVRTAPTMYPCFKFILAQFKDGQWTEKEIEPK